MARSKAPVGFDAIHRVLGGAMRAVPEATWPARAHLGGPLPVLSTTHQLDVAFTLAPTARALAPAAEHARFDELVAHAREVARGATGARAPLDDAAKPAKKDGLGLRCGKLILRAAINERYAPQSARDSIGRNVESLAAALAEVVVGHGADATRAFLADLDAVILVGELRVLLEGRAFAPTSPIARVVSRPRTATGSLALVLAGLADGRYGLYAKLKARWEWHEGDRATVFATVPDAYMEHVIADLDA